MKDEVGKAKDRDGDAIDRGEFEIAHRGQTYGEVVHNIRDPFDQSIEAFFPTGEYPSLRHAIGEDIRRL